MCITIDLDHSNLLSAQISGVSYSLNYYETLWDNIYLKYSLGARKKWIWPLSQTEQMEFDSSYSVNYNKTLNNNKQFKENQLYLFKWITTSPSRSVSINDKLLIAYKHMKFITKKSVLFFIQIFLLRKEKVLIAL